MPSAVIDVINGPSGESPKELRQWLEGVRAAFAKVSESSLSRVAEPLQAAIGVLERLDKPGTSDADVAAADAELFGHLVHVRGLALFSYLEELNNVRNLVAAEVAKQKPGSPERKKGERLQGAYEQAIDGLARAYNGLREGRLDELKTVGPVMEEVRKIAQELGAGAPSP